MILKKLLLALCLTTPWALFAGDPIPDIDITVNQTLSRITKSGKTNSKGELVLTGFKPGSVIITIKCNNQLMVIGKKKSDRISIPSSSRSSIKPIRLDLALYSTSKTNQSTQTFSSESGTPQTRGSGVSVTDVTANHRTYSRSDGDSGSDQHGTSKMDNSSNGIDDDCDGIVEITFVEGDGLKIKLISKM